MINQQQVRKHTLSPKIDATQPALKRLKGAVASNRYETLTIDDDVEDYHSDAHSMSVEEFSTLFQGNNSKQPSKKQEPTKSHLKRPCLMSNYQEKITAYCSPPERTM